MDKIDLNWTCWLKWIALIIPGILFAFFFPVKILLNFYVDDGFFYLKIAKNFSQGLGSTFDGINYTNGYHPLWFIVLSFSYFITSLFINNPLPDLLLRVSTFVHYIFIILSYYFIYKSFKIIYSKNYLSCTILFIGLSLSPLAFRNFGLEIHTITLLLALYLFVKSKEIILNQPCTAGKIIIYCLLGLSRIDFFFSLVPVLILFDSYNKNLKIFVKTLLKYSVPVSATAILYFFVNYIYFGHFFSISGTIKNSFPESNFTNNIQHLFSFIDQKSFVISNFAVQLLVFILLSVKLLIRKNEINRIEKILFHVFIGFIIFFIINFLFNKELFQEWYFAGSVFLCSITFVVLLYNQQKLIIILSVSFLIISVLYVYHARIEIGKFSTLYDYAIELRSSVPENDEILQIDYSGIVGFISNRKVVNGDGLVNSFEYYEYYKASKLDDYVKKYHIDYYSSYTAVIDSSTNTVYEIHTPAWGGYRFEFPIKNIKLRRVQFFDSYKFSSVCEWLLIKFN